MVSCGGSLATAGGSNWPRDGEGCEDRVIMHGLVLDRFAVPPRLAHRAGVVMPLLFHRDSGRCKDASDMARLKSSQPNFIKDIQVRSVVSGTSLFGVLHACPGERRFVVAERLP